MPYFTNFFWATFFILYDPLEFSTGACPTPSGLEIAKTHHCALSKSLRVYLQLILRGYYGYGEDTTSFSLVLEGFCASVRD